MLEDTIISNTGFNCYHFVTNPFSISVFLVDSQKTVDVLVPLVLSTFQRPCISFHPFIMGTMSDSLINHTLNKIQTLKEQVFALNFWSHFETNVPHVCQVRVREKKFMLERDAEETKKNCMGLCQLFCFDLSCYYLLSPAVKCAAVIAPHETRRQTEGVFLLSEDCYEFSSLCCRCAQRSLCKQENERGREDAEDKEQR